MAFFVRKNRSQVVRRLDFLVGVALVIPLIPFIPTFAAWLAHGIKPTGPIAIRLLSAEHTAEWSDVTGLLSDVIGTASSSRKATVDNLASLTPILEQAGLACRAKVSAQKHSYCKNPGAGWTPNHCRREWKLTLYFEGPGQKGNIAKYTAAVRSVCDTV